MFKPVKMDACTAYVCPRDSAIDWDRIAEKMLEQDEKLRDDQELSPEQKRNLALAKFSGELQEKTKHRVSATVELLIPKDGEKVTKFVLGVIPSDELNRITDECGAGGKDARPSEQMWRCFLAGLRNIENWPGAEKLPTREVGGISYIDPIWLRSTFVGPLRKVALDVGMAVLAFNSITEDEVKN